MSHDIPTPPTSDDLWEITKALHRLAEAQEQIACTLAAHLPDISANLAVGPNPRMTVADYMAAKQKDITR